MRFLTGDARRAHVREDLLSGYLDNQVTAAQRARIEAHMHDCAACRADLSSLRQTVQLLRALPRVGVPRAFTLSEAQVGRVSNPARYEASTAQAPWYRGALRGVAALAGVALVVAVGALWLRWPGLAPSTRVARVAVTALPAAALAPAESGEVALFTPTTTRSQAAESPKAGYTPAPSPSPQVSFGQSKQPTQAPGPSAPAQSEKAVQDSTQAGPPAATARPAPSATPGQARAAMPPAAPAAAAPTAPASAPTLAPAPTNAPTTQKPALALAGPTASTPLAGAGRGGGGPAGSAPTIQGAPLPPASLAATSSITATFPQDAGLAYADGQGLWTIDRQAGLRQIGQAPGASMLMVAPDRTWIAYLVSTVGESAIRTMRWDGSSPRTLVSDATLPAVDQSKPSAVRQLTGDFRWVPGTHRVAFTIASDETPPGQPAQSKVELWDVDVESGALRHLFDLTPNSAFAYSPNGALVALLRRGSPGQNGGLAVLSADGTRERKVLDFPANAAGYAFDGQLAWLPDGRALWAAIPDRDTTGTPANSGITLYRIPATGGNAEPVRHIETIDAAWSPDGTQLVYSKPIANTPDSEVQGIARQLVLASADGTNVQPYATIDGGFQGWSPDSKYFLYTNAEAWYIGMAGQPPRRTGDTTSMPDLRWITGQQLVYPANQPGGTVLGLMSLDGKTIGLTPLGAVVAFDATRR